jgi:fucose permease
VSFIFAGFGNGLADSGWNAWIGNMADANQVLGLLHGFYGAGAVLAPLVATALVTKAGVGWWYFYYIMVCLSSSPVWVLCVDDGRLAARSSSW